MGEVLAGLCEVLEVFGEIFDDKSYGDGRLRHRGPDWSGLFVDEKCGCYLAHERLAIIDPTSGDQPLFNEAKDIVVAVSLLLTHARVGFCCIVVCPAQCA